MVEGPWASFPAPATAMPVRPVPWRWVVVAVLRVVAIVGLTLLTYSLLPIGRETGVWIVLLASVALVGLAIAFGVLLSRISRSPQPLLAGIESLMLVFGLFLSLFAFIYVSLSAIDPDGFTAPVDKVAGIYFSMTILATVGFGDISAVTDTTRIAVTVQMVLDLVLIGAAFKLLVGATRRAVERVAETGTGIPGTGVPEMGVHDDVLPGDVPPRDVPSGDVPSATARRPTDPGQQGPSATTAKGE